MKNVMKKVFSLILVGVVAVSMFGFVAPTRAEAAGCAGELCLEWYDKENYCNGNIDIYIYFLDSYGTVLDTYDAKTVGSYNGWVIKFPAGTTSITFEVYDGRIGESVLYHDSKFEHFTSPYAKVETWASTINKNGGPQIVMKSKAKPLYC